MKFQLGQQNRLNGLQWWAGVLPRVARLAGRHDVTGGVVPAFAQRNNVILREFAGLDSTIGTALTEGCFDRVPLSAGQIGDGGAATASTTSSAKRPRLSDVGSPPNTLPSRGLLAVSRPIRHPIRCPLCAVCRVILGRGCRLLLTVLSQVLGLVSRALLAVLGPVLGRDYCLLLAVGRLILGLVSRYLVAVLGPVLGVASPPALASGILIKHRKAQPFGVIPPAVYSGAGDFVVQIIPPDVMLVKSSGLLP